MVSSTICESCHPPWFLAGLYPGTAIQPGALGSAFYWFSVFCAVLLWTILKEICLALPVVLSRTETENGAYNINWHIQYRFLWSEANLRLSSQGKTERCVPVDEFSGFGFSGRSTGRHSDGPGQREPWDSHIPPCWLSFWGPWYKPRGTTDVRMQLPLKLSLLPSPKLALGQPGLKLVFHPPQSDCSHKGANLCGVQTAICFSTSSSFPWFLSCHCREWTQELLDNLLPLHPGWDQKTKSDIIVFIRCALQVPHTGQNKYLPPFSSG